MSGRSWRSDSNGYPHIFDHCRPRYDTADTARYHPTSETPNVGHGTGSGNRKWKPEVEIALKRNVLAMRFHRLHPHFRLPDSKMALSTRPDIGQHRKPEMSATEPEVETGSGNNYERKELAMRFQRLIPYFRPCQTQICHCPRSTDIRNSKCRRKPEVILTSGCPPMSDRVGQCR